MGVGVNCLPRDRLDHPVGSDAHWNSRHSGSQYHCDAAKYTDGNPGLPDCPDRPNDEGTGSGIDRSSIASPFHAKWPVIYYRGETRLCRNADGCTIACSRPCTSFERTSLSMTYTHIESGRKWWWNN